MDNTQLVSVVGELLAVEGIEEWGVSDVQIDEAASLRYAEWIAAGRHGSMAYLERHAPLKFDPARVVSGARSVIVVALNYFQAGLSSPKGAGTIARYAWGRDYHKELGKRLRRVARRLEECFPGELFRPFVDATPLNEAHLARKAGIGFTGRNTLVITRKYGSWVFLGEIVTSLGIAASGQNGADARDCPEKCARCLSACPTGALVGPRRIDARRCISYLTIEYSGAIPHDLREAMGTRVFGCDRCQEVCPLNRGALPTTVSSFCTPIAGSAVDLGELLSIRDDAEFVARFAGSPLVRAGRERMVRNALIAAGNAGDTILRPLVESYLSDKNEIVAESADWSLAKLAGKR